MGNNDMADFQHAATVGHQKNQFSLGDALSTRRIQNDSTLGGDQIPSFRETHSAAFQRNQVNPLVQRRQNYQTSIVKQVDDAGASIRIREPKAKTPARPQTPKLNLLEMQTRRAEQLVQTANTSHINRNISLNPYQKLGSIMPTP